MNETTYRQALEAWRAKYLGAELDRRGGNRSQTARDLGMQRTYLCRLIREGRVAGQAPATKPARRCRACGAPEIVTPGPAGAMTTLAPRLLVCVACINQAARIERFARRP
jgi:hypothetical protein